MNKSPALTTTPSTANQIGSRRLAIVLYVTIGFLYWTSMYLYVPTLPVYVEGKINNLAMVGVVLSMYGLWQAVLRLPLGIAADWLGWRKPFILSGLVLAALGAAMLGLAQGVLNPVLMGMSIQYVADAERTTAMGLHQSVQAIGMFAGPWFSGILAEALGLRPMLGITTLACLVLSYAMATRLSGPRQAERPD